MSAEHRLSRRALLKFAIASGVSLTPLFQLGRRIAEALSPEPGSLLFPEGVFYPLDGNTQGFGVEGFLVEDPMNSFYQERGGKRVWGGPISRQYIDVAGRPSQAFEKGIMQLTAEGKGSYSIGYLNIFDELSRFNKDDWLETVRSTPKSFDWTSDAGKPWGHTPEGPLPGTIEENHFKILDAYPALKAEYLSNPAWFEQYGLPMAIEDVGTFIPVRGQRAVLQLWKVEAPWAKKGQVVVANGGIVAKEAGGIIPESALKPQAVDNEMMTEREIIKDNGDGTYQFLVTRKRLVRYPSYYSQFEHTDDCVIRAAAYVDPRALTVARESVTDVMSRVRPEYRQKIKDLKPAFLVIPRNEPLHSLPEISNLFAIASINPDSANQLRGYSAALPGSSNRLMAAAGEEQLTGPQQFAKNTAIHELAHDVSAIFTAAEKNQWLNTYKSALSNGRASSLNVCDYNIYGSDEKCADEYWAELSRMFIQNQGSKIAQTDPDAFSFLQRVYQ